LTRLSNYFLLGLCWLLGALLVITLVPVTAGLYAVFKTWQDNPDDPFYGPLLLRLRNYARSDTLLGLVWLFLLALLVTNGLLIGLLATSWQVLALALLMLACLLFAATSAFLFTLRVQSNLPLWSSLRVAVMLGMSQLDVTLLSVGCASVVAWLGWQFPPSLLVLVPALAHYNYHLAARRINRVL
jgi:uncharacterized membrane protein YesL